LLAFLHLISVRTELVRTECYYIWYWKASKPLYLGALRLFVRNWRRTHKEQVALPASSEK
jgi:hypothetical protein